MSSPDDDTERLLRWFMLGPDGKEGEEERAAWNKELASAFGGYRIMLCLDPRRDENGELPPVGQREQVFVVLRDGKPPLVMDDDWMDLRRRRRK